MAEKLLRERGTEPDVIDITEDAEKRMWLVEETGKRTVPQIWIGETYVGGYDDLSALDREDKLQELLDS